MPKVELTYEQDKLAKEISLTLREHLPWARTIIRQIIQEAGEDFARQLLDETQQIQNEGGMLTLDESQKRTIGGVFFYLARNRLPPETAERLFARKNRRKKSAPRYIDWEKRTTIIEERLNKTGRINEMRVTLIGKPKSFTRTFDTVVTQMVQLRKQESFPNGLPPLPEHETLYTVYIAAKQWDAVQKDLKRKDQWLKIDGEAFYDEAIPGISVFAISMKLKTFSPADQDVPEMAEVDPSEIYVPQEKPAVVEEAPPEHVPDIRVQIETLHSALDQYEKRLAELEKDPEKNRAAINITRKLLTNTQKQAADLARK